MATAAARKPFDKDRFIKLLLLMDSGNEFEQERATGQALQMCGAAGLRFLDAAAASCGQGGKRIAELEEQLENARRGGDELAGVVEEYQKAERTRRRFCRPCELKRRAIAGLTGVMILAGWFYAYPPQEVTPRWTGYGAMLAAVPFVFLVCRWALIQFKRKHHWVAWRNNDVFRAAADKWNGFLSKFVINEVNSNDRF
jgi:hypothetical protein